MQHQTHISTLSSMYINKNVKNQEKSVSRKQTYVSAEDLWWEKIALPGIPIRLLCSWYAKDTETLVRIFQIQIRTILILWFGSTFSYLRRLFRTEPPPPPNCWQSTGTSWTPLCCRPIGGNRWGRPGWLSWSRWFRSRSWSGIWNWLP